MLHIVNVEEIQGLLLGVPALVDRLERREVGFPQQVDKWLTQVEQALTSNRMPVAGNIAALRGQLAASGRGAIPPGIAFHGRPTARKIREATAAEILRQAADLISNALRDDASRIAEAERLTHQMVALAASSGLVGAQPAGIDRTSWLRETWAAMCTDPNIAAGAVRVEGLVGKHDALIILDRAITPDAV